MKRRGGRGNKRPRKTKRVKSKKVVKRTKQKGGGRKMNSKTCPVKKRLKKHIPFLHVLKDASPKMRTSIIKAADAPLINTLSECSLNVLNGNQRISPQCKKLLTGYKNQLRNLATASPRVSIKRKKQILLQKGGFIIPTLIGSVLSGLLSDIL